MIEDITKRPYDDVRAAYKKYLNQQNLSVNTISVSSSDTFYIWRKLGADTFWDIVKSVEFEAVGKKTLLELLHHQSPDSAYSNMHGYMGHMRKFRQFLQSESAIEIPEAPCI